MLEFRRLETGYASCRCAPPLSLTWESGRFVVLLGRNGSGKTTLLRTVAGLLPPLAGEVCWQGQSLAALSPAARALCIARVSAEDRAEVDFMSVRDLVGMGRFPHTNRFDRRSAEDNRLIDEALDTLQIGAELAARPLSTCSEGERQLVLLARALAQDTPLLLLDEATAHLDFWNRRRIFRHLRLIADQTRKLVLLATHELDLAAEFADAALALAPPDWCADAPPAAVAWLKSR